MCTLFLSSVCAFMYMHTQKLHPLLPSCSRVAKSSRSAPPLSWSSVKPNKGRFSVPMSLHEGWTSPRLTGSSSTTHLMTLRWAWHIMECYLLMCRHANLTYTFFCMGFFSITFFLGSSHSKEESLVHFNSLVASPPPF